MVVPEQVQARLHGGEHLVDLRLAGVGSASCRETRGTASAPRGSGRRRRRRAAPCTPRPPRARSAAACRRARSPSRVPFFGCGRSAAGVSYHVGANVPPRPATSTIGSSLVADLDDRPVGDVDEVLRQVVRGDRVEVVVVAVNPVDAGAERFVAPVFVGDVADAEPERDLGMARDDRPRGVERAVDVA